jgi:hypothetical protein
MDEKTPRKLQSIFIKHVIRTGNSTSATERQGQEEIVKSLLTNDTHNATAEFDLRRLQQPPLREREKNANIWGVWTEKK